MQFSMKDQSTHPFAWVLEGSTREAFETSGVGIEQFADDYVRGVINGANYSAKSDEAVFAEWAESGERAQLIAYLDDQLGLGAVLDQVEGVDGMQAAYAKGEYTITIWDDMDGGYDAVFTKSDTFLAHERIDGLSRESAIVKMREFNPNVGEWHRVEYES